MPDAEDYLGPEAKARVEIDKQLTAAGWVVQRPKQMNLGAGRGVAVREFPMAHGHPSSIHSGESDGQRPMQRTAASL